MNTRGYKHWIGTIYKHSDGSDITSEEACVWTADTVDARLLIERCAWSHEICPDTDRDHIQIYAGCFDQVRFNSFVRVFDAHSSTHWECARDPSKSWDYCTEAKEDPSSRHGTPGHGADCPSHSWGTRPVGSTGIKGLDIVAVTEFIRSGKRERDLLEPGNESVFAAVLKHTAGFRYLRGIAQRPHNTPDEYNKPIVAVLYGATGTGA